MPPFKAGRSPPSTPQPERGTEETTGINGGYTMKVPEGVYRLEIELQPGETITKQPGETRVNRSDLDPRRDFVITAKR